MTSSACERPLHELDAHKPTITGLTITISASARTTGALVVGNVAAFQADRQEFMNDVAREYGTIAFIRGAKDDNPESYPCTVPYFFRGIACEG